MNTLGYRKPKGLLKDQQQRRITPKSAWLRKLERSQRRPIKRTKGDPQWFRDALRAEMADRKYWAGYGDRITIESVI